VSGTREFKAGGDDGGVEINDGAELNLQPELHHAGRKRPAVKDPAAAVGKGRSQHGEQAVAFFVAEALDVEGLHLRRLAPRLDTSADRPFIGSYREIVMGRAAR